MARDSTVAADPGFLELESMASMHRIGEEGTTHFAGGSTLAELDGLTARQAEAAARDKRADIAHGHHLSERYRVVGEIARGGMGAIIEVHDSDLDRRVAMKVLLRDTRKSESDTGSPLDTGPVNRFLGEAQLTGNLEHPNIVPVHELGLDSQGRVYFTMKRVKGRSLRQVMDKLRQGDESTLAEFSLGKLLAILLKVCDAIEFSHSRGIIHRDLKPENIMVGQFGEVLVMDWGLAKQLNQPESAAAIPTHSTRFSLDVSLGAAEGDSEQTREGTVSGTPAYMSPEQARGKVNELSVLTDVFCLGGILYEMLCLVPPFLAADMYDALELATAHELLPPRQKLDAALADAQLKRAFGQAGIARGRKHPRELVSIAFKAMAEQPAMRYAGVADFKRDIERYLSAQPVSAHRDGPFARATKWSRRNPTRAAVVTLGLFFALLAGVVFAAARAKLAADRYEYAEAARSAVEKEREAVQGKLAAEANAREQAERAREEADARAELERRNREREAREAEALAARTEAFVPYSKGADLRARAASFTDWREKARLWAEAAGHFRRALERDPDFVEAHLELANVYADLGYDDDALAHYARADALTASRTGRGHVEALMAYAMYDFQRRVLREGLSGGMEQVFQRFVPVRAAAEPGSPYARIAQVLLDLGEAFRNAQGAELLRARDSAAARLAEIEREAVPLWEVYTLLALFEQGAESSRTDYLRRAFELKPNLPLLVRLEVLQTARNTSVSEHRGVEAWNEFIDNFPYDPRGYFSRAALRFSSDSEHNYAAEVADLRKSLERNPRYADAHKLLLRVYVREGNEAAAIEHLDTMRRSQSGLDHTAINLIEAELTASTGRFDRLAVLVLSSMQENTADGIEILAQAVSVLLRDHEYEELVNLCLAVQQRLASAPPAVSLFLGRGLTMLARFDEGLERLAPLEENPGLLPRNFRGTLEGWIADAREYPVLLSSLHSVPAPRRRFDLGRILAVAGRDPDVWVPLLETQGINPNDAVNWVHPGDYVLQAKGNAMRARRAAGPQARGLRALAVQQLKDALEQGYLNRKRIYEDEYLAPLVTDEELSKFFPAG